MIVYQAVSERDGLEPVIETARDDIMKDTQRQLVMINTCLNVNKVLPSNQIERYANMVENGSSSSEDGIREHHDTLDVPAKESTSLPYPDEVQESSQNR